MVFLHELSQLRNLDLRGTQVTEAGIGDLLERLPLCDIDSDFWD